MLLDILCDQEISGKARKSYEDKRHLQSSLLTEIMGAFLVGVFRCSVKFHLLRGFSCPISRGNVHVPMSGLAPEFLSRPFRSDRVLRRYEWLRGAWKANAIEPWLGQSTGGESALNLLSPLRSSSRKPRQVLDCLLS